MDTTEPAKLTKLRRRAGRVDLIFAGIKEPLTVSEEMVYQHRLTENIVITQVQLAQLKVESELYLCDRKAAHLMAMRQHSVGELRAKLQRKGFSTEATAKIIAKFRASGLLDDGRYALQLADKLVREKPCGRSFLMAHLQRKLIDRQTASTAAELSLQETSEESLAEAALQRRWLQFARFELETARKKSYNYLARRGFGYGAAKKAFEKMNYQQEEVSDD